MYVPSYGLAADRQEYCFTTDFYLFIYFLYSAAMRDGVHSA